jgi:hypothetical protein
MISRYMSAVITIVDKSLNGANEPIGPAKPSAAASAWNGLS